MSAPPSFVESLKSAATSILERQMPPLPSIGVTATNYFPHVIHQTWRSAQLPSGLQRLSHTWRKHLPRWKYQLHTDADNLELVQRSYSWLLPAYRRFSPIQRADTARYLYMHAVGGIYADLDVELLQPLRSLLRAQRLHNASVLLGQEPLAHALLLERKPRQVCNAVLASVRGHPFWLEVLRRVAGGAGGADPVGSTGPRMLEAALEAWNASGVASGAASLASASSRRSRRRRDASRSKSKGNGGGAVVVVAPDVFFPTWDPMQAATFRRRCGDRGLTSRHGSSDMGLAITAVCNKLRADGFRPTVPRDGSAFTNHLWSHTWIRGAEKRNVIGS